MQLKNNYMEILISIVVGVCFGWLASSVFCHIHNARNSRKTA
jgi:hypothetical protein